MSNLGWYQIMTTWSKKVGGPLQLMGLFAGGGFVLGGGTVTIGKSVKKKIGESFEKKRKAAEKAIIHTVHTESRSNEGLLFKEGDTFRILETDGDAALIEIIGNDCNPYFVSLKFLRSISD